MPRPSIATRTATVADIPVLVELWQQLKSVGARTERAVNPVTTGDVGERLAQAIQSADCRVVIACADGKPVGMAVFRIVQPDPLSDSRLLQLSHLVVAESDRRRGVGRALITAGADLADEWGIEHVGVGVYPSLRDASRFYARLGFAQLTVQRVAPVTVLRRRLLGDAASRWEEAMRRRSRMRRPVPAQRASRRRGESADVVGRNPS